MTQQGTTQLLEGKKSAAAIRDEAAATVQRLRAAGVVPSLALVLATADESAAWYTRAIARAGEKVGIDVRVERLADDASAATSGRRCSGCRRTTPCTGSSCRRRSHRAWTSSRSRPRSRRRRTSTARTR